MATTPNQSATFIATPEQRSIHTRIRQDRDGNSGDNCLSWKDIIQYRAYTAGKHAIILTDKQKTILRNLLNDRFCDNVCKQIVGEANGRIAFKGWECSNEPVKKWLDQFYKRAKVAARQSDIHFKSLRDGNFALAVNWDAKCQFVNVFKENWWDGICGVYIHYDDTDCPDYAVKEWTYIAMVKSADGQAMSPVQVKRRVIWFEDQVQKWESLTGVSDDSWFPAPLPEDVDGNGDQQWPVPWLDSDGNPMGIPYIHFTNAQTMHGDYGLSELAGGVLGFQDQLNDMQYNITITGKMTGAQMYYATGVKLRKDPATQVSIPITVDAGMFHTSENEKSQFGTLPPGDIQQQIAGYNLKLKRVAQMTATPVHIITGGDWPSGEALLRAELPAVSKAKTQIESFKDSWISAATMAMKIYNRFKPLGKETINYDIDKGIVEACFDDPEKRDIVSRSIVVHNMVPNISIREGLRILGYSEERAQDVWDEMVEEQQKSADTMLTASTARATPGSGTSNKESMGGNNNSNSQAK
jgi:hypothetical protein